MKLTFVLDLSNREIKETLCQVSGKLYTDKELKALIKTETVIEESVFEDSDPGTFAQMKAFLLGVSMIVNKQ